MRKKFEQWAKEFILITQDMIDSFDTKDMSLEEAKMQFSHLHQDLFTDSWEIRSVKIFTIHPVEGQKKIPLSICNECIFGDGGGEFSDEGGYGECCGGVGHGNGDYGTVFIHYNHYSGCDMHGCSYDDGGGRQGLEGYPCPANGYGCGFGLGGFPDHHHVMKKALSIVNEYIRYKMSEESFISSRVVNAEE